MRVQLPLLQMSLRSFLGVEHARCNVYLPFFRVLASTQFEATFARAAFPCFDEPAFKAKFTIRIVREPRHIAVSNMPIVGAQLACLPTCLGLRLPGLSSLALIQGQANVSFLWLR